MDSPRERIMNIASDLFYRQGYRATGINEVIQKSGVAKATFYSHFPTKEELCVAYLDDLKLGELAVLDNAVAVAKGSVNRFMAIICSLKPWLIETDYRGCGFVNIASEEPDPRSPLRKAGVDLYDQIRQRVDQLAEELIASDQGRYGHLNKKELCNDYMVIFIGAVAMAEIYHAIWPVEHAIKSVQRLIGE